MAYNFTDLNDSIVTKFYDLTDNFNASVTVVKNNKTFTQIKITVEFIDDQRGSVYTRIVEIIQDCALFLTAFWELGRYEIIPGTHFNAPTREQNDMCITFDVRLCAAKGKGNRTTVNMRHYRGY
jgi:hypothetical protein